MRFVFSLLLLLFNVWFPPGDLCASDGYRVHPPWKSGEGDIEAFLWRHTPKGAPDTGVLRFAQSRLACHDHPQGPHGVGRQAVIVPPSDRAAGSTFLCVVLGPFRPWGGLMLTDVEVWVDYVFGPDHRLRDIYVHKETYTM